MGPEELELTWGYEVGDFMSNPAAGAPKTHPGHFAASPPAESGAPVREVPQGPEETGQLSEPVPHTPVAFCVLN